MKEKEKEKQNHTEPRYITSHTTHTSLFFHLRLCSGRFMRTCICICVCVCVDSESGLSKSIIVRGKMVTKLEKGKVRETLVKGRGDTDVQIVR